MSEQSAINEFGPFIQGFGELCRKHKIYATNVKLEWTCEDPLRGEPKMENVAVEAYYEPS
jgi:hypothetical protein